MKSGLNSSTEEAPLADAADFAYEIGAKCGVPLHYGLFDDINPEVFDFEDKIFLKPFEEIIL